ncbi:MAG: aldo/keto reductase [Anaerolineaceae bacterium]|jgi:aryl-alcohol dehydrogenase-like predicted oxidoreductase|nr:aldo/keto reductase [Anaerolineaceae bacterium]
MTIDMRTLGKTGIEITPIGLGVMQFSGGKGVYGMMFPELSQEQKNTIVKTALDGGINWFDTAEMYGMGRSEQSLANALKALRMKDFEVVIATKWFPIFRWAINIPRTIKKRIHCLDGYTIDLYMVHQPWGFSPPEAEMDAMADLVEGGKIRSVGVSNFNAEQMRRAHSALQKRGLPLAVNQMPYSLLHRKIETSGVLDAAKELGVTIIAYTPLAYGVLSGKYHRDPERINQVPFPRKKMLQRNIERSRPLIEAMEVIAARYDATLAQVALNWVINFQGETVVTIPGATKVHQVEESAGAMKFKLSDDELSQLDELSRVFR